MKNSIKKSVRWFFQAHWRGWTNRECFGETLTVTALDLAVFRVLLARLINTSFSFNGAGASPQPSKVPFIWVIYGSSSRSTQGMADPVHISVWWSTPGLGKINRAIWEKINKWWALPLPNSPESLLRQSERRWSGRKRDFNMNFAPFNGGPGYVFSQSHPCSFILFPHAPLPIFPLLCHCVPLLQ